MKKDNVFLLWIGDELPELQRLCLRSLLLTGHKVEFWSYKNYDGLDDLPYVENLKFCDANEIIPEDQIWTYNVSNFGKGSVSGFANHWRLVYLEKFGGTWVDFDLLVVRNLQDAYPNQEILIGSEIVGTFKRGWERPNNNLLSFPKGDSLVKEMKSIAEDLGSKSKHAETGPKLLYKLIKSGKWKIYQKFVLDYQAVGPIIYTKSGHFVKKPMDQVIEEQNVDINRVYGFHVWNTYFTVNTKTNMFDKMLDDSLYAQLRDAINSSQTQEEYINTLKEMFPLYVEK